MYAPLFGREFLQPIPLIDDRIAAIERGDYNTDVPLFPHSKHTPPPPPVL